MDRPQVGDIPLVATGPPLRSAALAAVTAPGAAPDIRPLNSQALHVPFYEILAGRHFSSRQSYQHSLNAKGTGFQSN